MTAVLQPRVQLIFPPFGRSPKRGDFSLNVYNYSKIKSAFTNMNTGRTCFVAMGDSNQVRQGHGWDDALFQALGWAGYSCYGVNMYSAGENAFQGMSLGSNSQYFANTSTLPSWLTTTFTNSTLNNFNLNSDGSSLSQSVQALEVYATPAANQNNGMIVNNDTMSLIPGRATYFNCRSTKIKHRVTYGTSATGSGGQLDPTVRWGNGAYTQLNTAVVSTTTGVNSIQTYVSPDINASGVPDGFGIQASWTKITGASSTVSPGWIFYNEILDDNVTAGFRQTQLFAQGGQSAFDMAQWLGTRTDASLILFFQQLEATLNGGQLMVYVQTAANDTGETNASYVNSFSPGSSQAAYKDNMQYICQRLRDIWIAAGFATNRFKILLIPGHALGASYLTAQNEYIVAAKQVSDIFEGVAVFDTTVATTNALIASRSYYDSSTDTFHLQARGYAAITRQLMNGIGKGPILTYPAVSCADNNNTAWLSKASNLTGLTDLQSGILMFTLYNDNGANLATQGRILQGCDASNNVIFDLEVTNYVSTPYVRLRLFNTAGAAAQVNLWPNQPLGIQYSSRRFHFLISWNTVGQLYKFMINGAPTVANSSLVSSGVPALASITQWTMFGARTGASKMDGALGDFWLHFGTYIDFDVALNRRFFIDSNGNPSPVPDTGIINALTPNIFMRGTDMATGNNRGSGGNFTVNGSFTTLNIEG